MSIFVLREVQWASYFQSPVSLRAAVVKSEKAASDYAFVGIAAPLFQLEMTSYWD